MADAKQIGELARFMGQSVLPVAEASFAIEFLSRNAEFYRAFPEQIAKIRDEVREEIAEFHRAFPEQIAKIRAEVREEIARNAVLECDQHNSEKEKSALRKELAELREQLLAVNDYNGRLIGEKNDRILRLEKRIAELYKRSTERSEEFIDLRRNVEWLKESLADRNAKIAELTLRPIPVDKAKEFNNGGKTTGEQAEKSVEKSPGQKAFEATFGQQGEWENAGSLSREQWERAAAGVKS